MNRETLDTVDATLSQFTDEAELVELAPDETSLSFLQKVYRSIKQPMSRRMRAAIEAMPHEHPRLGAVAVMTGNDIATLLDRAIARSNAVMKIIEHDASEPRGNGQQPSQHTQEGQGNSSNATPVVVTTNPAAPFPRLRR
jgi:hypothetical protein